MRIERALNRAHQLQGHGLAYWQTRVHPGSVLALPLHAWISGAAHRFAALRETLLKVDAQDFWQAGPEQIAATWLDRQATESSKQGA